MATGDGAKRAKAASGASGGPGKAGKPGGSAGASAEAARAVFGTGLAKPMTPARIAAYLGLLVLGALVGIAGALVQAGWFPGGLLLALLGLAALCYGGVKATGSRVGGAAPGAGWLIVVLLLTATRPEGDFLFGAGLGTYVFLLGGMFAAVMCATLPKAAQPDRSPARLGK